MGGIADKGYVFVGIGTVLHFLVDGLCLCCIYLLTAPFELNNLLWLFVTYNILAFLTQPLTGWMADRISRKHWMLLFSVALLSLAVLLTPFFVTSGGKMELFVVAMLLGIGNSLFHVWGGKQVVMKVGNDIRCLGVFVSTGVFGLSVAMVFCSWTLLYVFLLAICILATVYIMTDKQVSTPSRHETNIAPLGFAACSMQERSSFNAQHLIALTALAAFVMFRSYIGTEFAFGTEKSDFVLLAIGFTSMLGKMAGGWFSRWFGILRALIVMLVIVLVCMLTGSKSLMVLLLGLFMINCTMPITLYLANYVLPEREGLAFGILAAALMPGYLLKS